MLDDPSVFGDQHKILIYFAEVKAGQRCTINGPWSKRPRQNIPRTLRAVGCIPDERVDDAANQLYQSCYYEDERVVVRLMAVGDQLNPIYENSKPNVVQITWDDAIHFIHRRFNELRVSKSQHDSWPESGRILWEMSEAKVDRFEKNVLARFPWAVWH